MMSKIQQDINELIDDFSFLEDWDDKYCQIIDMGKRLPELDSKFKTDEYKLHGCQSALYFTHTYDGNVITFYADSDSAIVKGLVAILFHIYSNRTPEEILETKPDFLITLELDQYLSPFRKNGLGHMVDTIMQIAKDNA